MHTRWLAIAALCLAMTALPGRAQVPLQLPTEPQPYTEDWLYPLVLATGAVAGVVGINLLSTGYAGFLPSSVANATSGPVADATVLGLSRLYTVVGAVTGGWIANWLYSGS